MCSYNWDKYCRGGLAWIKHQNIERGGCSIDLQRRHNGDVMEVESKKVMSLIEEILNMSDEEFDVLCVAALQNYGEPVKEKLWIMRSQTKT